MQHRAMHPPWAVLLTGSLLLGACASSRGRGAPSRYDFDTVTNTCRHNTANCTAMAGDRVALHPMHAVATAGGTLHAALHVLDATMKARLEEALKECANEARSEVLLRRMDGKSPTPEECREQVGVNERGEPVTRAMQLGEEMHEAARHCAEERLHKLRPGGFSLEQRYRHDRQTGQTTLLSREERDALLSRGRGHELLGTIEPDVVIHAGDPLHAEAIYDFKFPCVNIDEAPRWREYPRGHPYQRLTQKAVYEQALGKNSGAEAQRVVPRLGVIP